MDFHYAPTQNGGRLHPGSQAKLFVSLNIAQHFSADTFGSGVAQSLGTSRRTLERRVRAALNLTPLGFVQRLRIERARHLSATTDLTSAEIALRVGYANAETLRSLLRRERRRS